MSKRTVSGIILLLVLTSIWTLSFDVYPVRSGDGLLLEMEVNKTVITVGESIDIMLALKNVGENNVTITFGPPFFDVCYCTPEGCFRWSDGQYFIQVILDLILEPGETYTETLHWDLYQYINEEFCPPEPGTYDLFGVAIWTGIVTESIPITVYCWLPGDVNHDLKIDIYDVVRITGVYGSQQGDPNWSCHSDIAEPYDIIDIYDVVTCTKDYGKEYTP